jgi:hypothetical protein
MKTTLAAPGYKEKYEQNLKELHGCIAAARTGLVKGTC